MTNQFLPFHQYIFFELTDWLIYTLCCICVCIYRFACVSVNVCMAVNALTSCGSITKELVQPWGLVQASPTYCKDTFDNRLVSRYRASTKHNKDDPNQYKHNGNRSIGSTDISSRSRSCAERETEVVIVVAEVIPCQEPYSWPALGLAPCLSMGGKPLAVLPWPLISPQGPDKRHEAGKLPGMGDVGDCGQGPGLKSHLRFVILFLPVSLCHRFKGEFFCLFLSFLFLPDVDQMLPWW